MGCEGVEGLRPAAAGSRRVGGRSGSQPSLHLPSTCARPFCYPFRLSPRALTRARYGGAALGLPSRASSCPRSDPPTHAARAGRTDLLTTTFSPFANRRAQEARRRAQPGAAKYRETAHSRSAATRRSTGLPLRRPGNWISSTGGGGAVPPLRGDALRLKIIQLRLAMIAEFSCRNRFFCARTSHFSCSVLASATRSANPLVKRADFDRPASGTERPERVGGLRERKRLSGRSTEELVVSRPARIWVQIHTPKGSIESPCIADPRRACCSGARARGGKKVARGRTNY